MPEARLKRMKYYYYNSSLRQSSSHCLWRVELYLGWLKLFASWVGRAKLMLGVCSIRCVARIFKTDKLIMWKTQSIDNTDQTTHNTGQQPTITARKHNILCLIALDMSFRQCMGCYLADQPSTTSLK